MISARIPSNEAARLQALDSYGVLDTAAEPDFDDLTALAANICDTPIALLSLIDADRQWFKSHHGLATRQTPRELAFCAHAILETGPFIVPDATLDARFHDNPLTVGAPKVRFYAGSPLRDSDGQALGTICVIDHVARELSERQVDALARIGRQVVQRLESRRALDDAVRAARENTEFLVSFGHQLRTPLYAVADAAQELDEAATDGAQPELLAQVQDGTAQALDLVQRIVDFASLESGRVQLRNAPLDLYDLVREVLVPLRVRARARNIELRLEWRSMRAAGRIGDAARIRQILASLLENAIAFTPEGAVVLQVLDGEHEHEFCFFVEDTGIGMSAAMLETVFERHFRAARSTLEGGSGIGLGLVCARRLATMMGGTITAESVPGVGSRFLCTIPLRSSARTTQHAPEPMPVPLDLSGCEVLVAESSPARLVVLMRFLQGKNAKVTIVHDGLEALAAGSSRAFDLVLLGPGLPAMDGYEVASRLRELPTDWAKCVPIVAVGDANLDGAEAPATFTACVPAPVKRAVLAEVLGRVMSAEGAARTAPAGAFISRSHP